MISKTSQNQQIKVSAVVIKKNGDIINLGVIAKSKGKEKSNYGCSSNN